MKEQSLSVHNFSKRIFIESLKKSDTFYTYTHIEQTAQFSFIKLSSETAPGANPILKYCLLVAIVQYRLGLASTSGSSHRRCWDWPLLVIAATVDVGTGHC